MKASLDDWLEIISTHHPAEIELGLSRCQSIFQAICDGRWDIPTITVAGTNGKGSCVASLESLALTTSTSILTYTSPHLINYRERLRFGGKWLSEEQHIESLEWIHNKTADAPLTYFEYSTLSALYWANKLRPELLVLEVGLGGRLDAVNVVDADVAIISTVDYDHQDYLGDTLEQIAREKLGIVKANTHLILADDSVPTSCLVALSDHKAGIEQYDSDFGMNAQNQFWHRDKTYPVTLTTHLKPVNNLAASVVAFSHLNPNKLSKQVLSHAADNISVVGRFQLISDQPRVYIDVAHNPQAIKYLVNRPELKNSRVNVLLGMMKDKNISECVALLAGCTSSWFLCDLPAPRGMRAEMIASQVRQLDIPSTRLSCYSTPVAAYRSALELTQQEDSILVVLGSFQTLGPILEWLDIDVQ